MAGGLQVPPVAGGKFWFTLMWYKALADAHLCTASQASAQAVARAVAGPNPIGGRGRSLPTYLDPLEWPPAALHPVTLQTWNVRGEAAPFRA